MNISKGQAKEQQKQCAFPGCSNMFVGPAQRKYCDDQRCIDARKILAQKTRKPKQDTTADNLHLVKGRFPTGTMLRIQCAACGPSGRCQDKFMVVYESNRDIYPKYCERHRNAHQRARFEGKDNAQSKTE